MKIPILHVQGVQLAQQERLQPCINSSDDGQVYFFGRENRVYQISCFLVDSNLSPGQGYGVDRTFSGHLLGQWKTWYDKLLRVTQTVKNRRIVRIRFKTVDLFGHILSSVSSMDATQPFLCQIGLLFFSVCEKDLAPIPVIEGMDGESFPGVLTLEGYMRLLAVSAGRQSNIESFLDEIVRTRDSVPPSA
jgi:hypothetical protein